MFFYSAKNRKIKVYNSRTKAGGRTGLFLLVETNRDFYKAVVELQILF